MAKAVAVSKNDSITKILVQNKGINNSVVHGWLTKVKQLNPHISNLDHIFPGEKVLIPDSLNEPVTKQQIWANAFNNIPSSLTKPNQGNTVLYISNGTESIDMLADQIFTGTSFNALPHSTKRAILIHNNPGMEHCLISNRVTMGTVVNLSPSRLSEYDKAYWNRESSTFSVNLNQFDPTVLDLYQQAGPDDALTLAEMAKNLKGMGSAVVDQMISLN